MDDDRTRRIQSLDAQIVLLQREEKRLQFRISATSADPVRNLQAKIDLKTVREMLRLAAEEVVRLRKPE